MRNQSLGPLGMIAAVMVMAVLVPAPAAGQGAGKPALAVTPNADWTAPRMPWGAPDLQGVWDYRTMTPLERPRELAAKEVLTEEEAAEYEKQQNDRRADYDRLPTVHAPWWLDYGTELTEDKRTSLLVDPADGRLPTVTDEAKQRASNRRERRAMTRAVEDRSLGERCITFGMPRMPGAYNNNYQILQTPTHVAIVSEMIHDIRLIPLDGRPRLPDTVRQWHGDSRGYYDGNTLVVETTNFSPKVAFRGATESLQLVERFTRVDPDTVHYVVTVEDQATWARPWTALIPLTKTDQALYEYACHEGNRGLGNILHNARYEEDPNYADSLSK